MAALADARAQLDTMKRRLQTAEEELTRRRVGLRLLFVTVPPVFVSYLSSLLFPSLICYLSSVFCITLFPF